MGARSMSAMLLLVLGNGRAKIQIVDVHPQNSQNPANGRKLALYDLFEVRKLPSLPAFEMFVRLDIPEESINHQTVLEV
jgi:hypothetical protein